MDFDSRDEAEPDVTAQAQNCHFLMSCFNGLQTAGADVTNAAADETTTYPATTTATTA